MDLIEFLIIYLSCGSPLGVYFFLQNRKSLGAVQLWLKSLFTVFVWIPYAYRLLNDFITRRKAAAQSAQAILLDKRLKAIQKKLSSLELKSPNKISLFEIREVLERYAGLTLANRTNKETFNSPEFEIFRVSLRPNSQIAATCLHRRNKQRLSFHQALAEKDFLHLIEKLHWIVRDSSELRNLAREFVQLLEDQQTPLEIEKIFSPPQISEVFPVNQTEKEVWDSQERKRLSVKRISA